MLWDRGVTRRARTAPIIRETLRDSVQVREIFDSLLRNGARASLRTQGQALAARPLFDPGAGWCWQLDDVTDSEIEVEIALEGCYSLYQLRVLNATREGERLITPLPDTMVRTRRRMHRRVQADANDVLRDARGGGLGTYRLGTLAHEGFSFEAQSRRLYDVGETVEQLELHASDGAVFSVVGEVRSISPARLEGGYSYGVQLIGEPAAAGARWRDWIHGRLYPTIQTGPEHNDSVWQLFADAGYFSLSGKRPEEFEPDKESYFDFTRSCARARDIGARIVVPSARGAEASKGFIKPYSTTWLNQHMARRRDGGAPGRRMLREMYFAAYEPLLLDEDCKWILAMCEGTVSWTKMAHLAFARDYEGIGEAYLQAFRLMEMTAAPLTEEPRGDLRIARASADQREQVLDHLVRTRSRIYLESLDLLPETFDLEAVSRRWGQAGLERERALYIASRDGRALAAAIIERGTPGSNLFRLVDAVRLVKLAPLVADEQEEIFAQLLAAAADYFHRHGHRAFDYYREGADGRHTDGLRDLGPGTMCVFSHAVLPDFLDHVYRITRPSEGGLS